MQQPRPRDQPTLCILITGLNEQAEEGKKKRLLFFYLKGFYSGLLLAKTSAQSLVSKTIIKKNKNNKKHPPDIRKCLASRSTDLAFTPRLDPSGHVDRWGVGVGECGGAGTCALMTRERRLVGLLLHLQ